MQVLRGASGNTANVRLLKNLGTPNSQNVTGINKASQATILLGGAIIGSLFNPGDWVTITGILGMTQINGQTVRIVDVPSDLPSRIIVDINTLAFSTYTSGGTVSRLGTATTQNITGINKAAVATVLLGDTITGSGMFNPGDYITISGVVGMTQMNGTWRISSVPSDMPARILIDVDTRAFTTYTSGGTVIRPTDLDYETPELSWTFSGELTNTAPFFFKILDAGTYTLQIQGGTTQVTVSDGKSVDVVLRGKTRSEPVDPASEVLSSLASGELDASLDAIMETISSRQGSLSQLRCDPISQALESADGM